MPVFFVENVLSVLILLATALTITIQPTRYHISG